MKDSLGHSPCPKCNDTGMIHFMNMHPEDYEPPMPCPRCNKETAPEPKPRGRKA